MLLPVIWCFLKKNTKSIYLFVFIYLFGHLADAFIQRDLQ